MPATTRLPAVFLGHGSPMNTLEANTYTEAWAALGASLPVPRAVLAVSAHWCTRGSGVTVMTAPRTIHDFAGFPPELFAFQYPAPGDPELAAEVAGLLDPVAVAGDTTWGLDHGTWSVLAHVYPKADVPVVQLSIDVTKPPSWHVEVAKALAPLRDEGVLLVASGNVVHNLGMLEWDRPGQGSAPAIRFDQWARQAVAGGDTAALAAYDRHPEARYAVPTNDHYLPLLYAVGAGGADAASEIVSGYEMGSLSMVSFRFG